LEAGGEAYTGCVYVVDEFMCHVHGVVSREMDLDTVLHAMPLNEVMEYIVQNERPGGRFLVALTGGAFEILKQDEGNFHLLL
jgi:hypothetical protein